MLIGYLSDVYGMPNGCLWNAYGCLRGVYGIPMGHLWVYQWDTYGVSKRVTMGTCGASMENSVVPMGRDGARNFFLGGLSPPKTTFNINTNPYFTCFRKFSEWAQPLFGWAEPTSGAATTYGIITEYL